MFPISLLVISFAFGKVIETEAGTRVPGSGVGESEGRVVVGPTVGFIVIGAAELAEGGLTDGEFPAVDSHCISVTP